MDVKEPAPKYFPKMSPSEFLVWEREQEFKHEYVNGEVLAMSSASINHNRIATNIIVDVGTFLKDKSCDISEAICAYLLDGKMLIFTRTQRSFATNLHLMMKKLKTHLKTRL